MSNTVPSSDMIEPPGGQRGFYRVLTAVETSTFSGGMPPYPLITDAFRKALPSHATIDEYRRWGVPIEPGPKGEWVGPGPRVVRHQTSLTSAYRTYATWIVFWPDDQTTRELGNWLLQNLVEALPQTLKGVTRSSDWSQVTVAPYDPIVNGPINFWKDGSAMRTRSRDVSGAALTGPIENPIGPDNLVPTAPSPISGAGRWLLIAGVMGGLVWVLSKEAADPRQLSYRR